jgi:hypothetical protein
VLRDFGHERIVGLRRNENVVAHVYTKRCPSNEPHFVMVRTPAAPLRTCRYFPHGKQGMPARGGERLPF